MKHIAFYILFIIISAIVIAGIVKLANVSVVFWQLLLAVIAGIGAVTIAGIIFVIIGILTFYLIIEIWTRLKS